LPSAKAHSTVSRQWELLRQLPSKSPGITTSEITTRLQSAGYTISKRTVERDLIDLSLMFPLQCNDASAPYGWYWKPGVSVELQGITLTEALSLALVEDAIRPLLPNSMLKVLEPRFSHARQKLKTLGEENHAARWLDKVASVSPDLNLQAPDIPEDILETLQQALLEEKQLQCQYYSAHTDKLSQLTLNPLALVQRGLITYLIGTAHPYTDVRQYAVHRFRQLTLSPTSTEGLRDFNLQAYLRTDALQFGKVEKIAFQAWISEKQARLLRETPLSADMMMTDLGKGYRVTATISDSWQLQWWILSLGDGLIVEKPQNLREQIAQKLRSAAAAYE
jgi:Predicted transcriptional regulator